MVNISSLVISIKICINDYYRLNTIFYHCRGPMLNNCTGLKNFDGKQDFVKKKYVVFCLKNAPKRKNASKRKMRTKPGIFRTIYYMKLFRTP